jgi:hypothetical protein
VAPGQPNAPYQQVRSQQTIIIFCRMFTTILGLVGSCLAGGLLRLVFSPFRSAMYCFNIVNLFVNRNEKKSLIKLYSSYAPDFCCR